MNRADKKEDNSTYLYCFCLNAETGDKEKSVNTVFYVGLL